MSLLKQVLEDMGGAVTAAGDCAGSRGVLFGSPMKRKIDKPDTKVKRVKFNKAFKTESFLESALKKLLAEEEFNSLDVISKLQYAEKNVERDTKSVAFGLEDKNGDVVKVYIETSQAHEFEIALQRELKQEDQRDIAEILFELRNKFNIMHVTWPTVPEDEEVDMKLQPKDGESKDGDGLEGVDLPSEDGDSKDGKDGKSKDDELDLAMDPENGAADSSGSTDVDSLKGMMDKIIDMLKSDSEARQAESNAKAKEAQAREAEAAARIAHTKVKSEEEVLSAENFYKQQQTDKKESQKLGRLAAYRQAMAQKKYTNDFDGSDV
jgi:hypothetical protein